MYYVYGFDPQDPIKTDLEVFICDSRTQKIKLRRQEIQSHSQLPKGYKTRTLNYRKHSSKSTIQIKANKSKLK